MQGMSMDLDGWGSDVGCGEIRHEQLAIGEKGVKFTVDSAQSAIGNEVQGLTKLLTGKRRVTLPEAERHRCP